MIDGYEELIEEYVKLRETVGTEGAILLMVIKRGESALQTIAEELNNG